MIQILYERPKHYDFSKHINTQNFFARFYNC